MNLSNETDQSTIKKPHKDRYFPNREETDILENNIEEYFRLPKNSPARKDLNIKITNELNAVHPGQWTATSVRVWLTNNQKKYCQDRPATMPQPNEPIQEIVYDQPNFSAPLIIIPLPHPDNSTLPFHPPPKAPLYDQQSLPPLQPRPSIQPTPPSHLVPNNQDSNFYLSSSETSRPPSFDISRQSSSETSRLPSSETILPPSFDISRLPSSETSRPPSFGFSSPFSRSSFDFTSTSHGTFGHVIPQATSSAITPSNPVPPMKPEIKFPQTVPVVQNTFPDVIRIKSKPDPPSDSPDDSEPEQPADLELPPLPEIPSELKADDVDTFKYKLYKNHLRDCYSYLRKLKVFTPSERLRHQQEIEERFVHILTLFNRIGITNILSKDPTGTNVQLRRINRMFSITTRQYNDETPGNFEPQILKENEFISYPKALQPPRTIEPSLRPFYYGKYDERLVLNLRNIEVAAFNPDTGTFMTVVYGSNQKIFKLVQGGKEANHPTGFFARPNSMIIHDRICYIQGDVRIKAFDTVTLECIDTMHIRDDIIRRSALAIWDDKIVVGFDHFLYFYPLSDDSAKSKKPNQQLEKRYSDFAQRNGIELRLVDWTYGRSRQKKSDIIDNQITNITCLLALGDYLVVASESYPVMHLYNKNGEIVSRLIGHTMGISCLYPYKDGSDMFFSGSLDSTIKLWSVELGVAQISFLDNSEKITSLATAEILNHTFLFSGARSSIIHVWDVDSKKPTFEIDVTHDFYPSLMDFVTDDSSLTIIASAKQDDVDPSHIFDVPSHEDQIQIFRFKLEKFE